MSTLTTADEVTLNSQETPKNRESNNIVDGEDRAPELSQDEAAKPDFDPDSKEKKKPYVNPERVKTGGTQRDKLSEEELVERMARMKEQNEKIKQRRMDVQADEDAFRRTQESERIRLAQNRKVQEHVNHTREQNARRKMEKIQTREWDSGKSAGIWKSMKKETGAEAGIGGGPRGGSHARAPRSRGRARDKGSGDLSDEMCNGGTMAAVIKSRMS